MSRYPSGLRWVVPVVVGAAVLGIVGARAGNSQGTGSIATVGQGGFAATAHQVNINVTLGAGLNNQTGTVNLPANRRFVIERVGLTGTQPANQAVYYNIVPTMNSVQSTYPLVGGLLGPTSSFTTSQVRYNAEQDGLYAEGTLRFNITRAATTGQVNVTMAVAGHLEP
jgi:hypothetical protein